MEFAGILIPAIAVLSVLIAFAGTFISYVRERIQAQDVPVAETGFKEQMSSLTRGLTDSSNDIDRLISQITLVTAERALAVQVLEGELADLESREQRAIDRISALENIPVVVADHFADLLTTREKRNARRDYLLFIAGAVVTTIIALVIQIFV